MKTISIFFLTCCLLLTACMGPYAPAVHPTESPMPARSTFASSTPTATAQVFPTSALSLEDLAYLNEALDIIQKNALNSNKVDWSSLRPLLISGAKYQRTRKDMYGLIKAALFELHDNHSRFLTPEEAAALQTETPTEDTQPQYEMVEGRYGEVIMPGFISVNSDYDLRYADDMQQNIRELDQKNPCGWIVDLSNNPGGNMWPMLAGLGPILGDGTFGYFITPDGNKDPWTYQNGKALQGSELVIQVSGQPYYLAHPDAPVAVLLGENTASAGEIIALSFIGRPNTRSFGRKTSGLTTSNGPFPMSDGAEIILTVAVDADHTGKVYGQEILPDVETQGTGVPKEAIQWLAEQQACK